MSAIAFYMREQLGGSKFVAMTGATNFVAGPRHLSFKIGRNPKGVTHVRIDLNSNDEYDVQFFKIRGTSIWVVLAKVEGVQCDNLRAVFESQTGLATKL